MSSSDYCCKKFDQPGTALALEVVLVSVFLDCIVKGLWNVVRRLFFKKKLKKVPCWIILWTDDEEKKKECWNIRLFEVAGNSWTHWYQCSLTLNPREGTVRLCECTFFPERSVFNGWVCMGNRTNRAKDGCLLYCSGVYDCSKQVIKAICLGLRAEGD